MTTKISKEFSTDSEATAETLTAEVERLTRELKKAKRTPIRHRLPDTRESITHKFSVSGHEGYITVGLYPDGRPGEMFLTMAKQGSTMRGLTDTIAVLCSLCLQYGVPVDTLSRKFAQTRFEPSGHTRNPDIPEASSLADYIFRWLGLTFGEGAGQDLAKESLPTIDDG